MWCRKWIWDKTKWTLICKTSFKMKNLQLFRTNNSLSNRNTLLEDYSHLCIFIPRELMNWHDLFHVKEMKLEKKRAFSIFLLKSLPCYQLPNSCNSWYFNVVCIGLFVLFIIILISLSALRPSFLHSISVYIFCNILLD